MSWLLCLAIALLGSTYSTSAQPVSTDPKPPAAGKADAPRRLVRLFDFEEPNNPDPVPAQWGRAQDDPDQAAGFRRPGYPPFNQAEFDHTKASSGASSVRLPTLGGSTALRLDAGEIPVFPDADYAVSAMVRTSGLEHARAFLVARLLDQKLQPIAGSEVRSDPVLSPSGWSAVRLAVPGRFKDATWLQIDLELLQPRMFEPSPPAGPLAQHKVWREDVSGAALFDDVSVALLPRTKFWTGTPKSPSTSIFTAPSPIQVSVSARDQGGDLLNARLRLINIDDTTVSQHAAILDPSGRPLEWSVIPASYGWYRVILEIDASGVTVFRAERPVAYVPGASGAGAEPGTLSSRFGLIADDLDEATIAQVPEIVAAARTRFLTIPAFDVSADVASARSALNARTPIIERLLNQGQEITLALSGVPSPIASAMLLDSTDALGLSARDASAWQPYLDPTLDVFGQRVVRYQVGKFGDQSILRQDPTAGIANLRTLVSQLVPGPRIVLPWRADRSMPVIGPAAVNADALLVQFPLGFEPRVMADLGTVWRARSREGVPFELTISPELPDMTRFGPRARSVEAARRLVEFWAALGGAGETSERLPAPRFALSDAIITQGEIGARTLHPAPELAVLAHMADRLSGRRIIAEATAPDGVRALLLAQRSGRGETLQIGESLTRACVIAWNEYAPAERAYVDVFTTGDQVEAVDPFGNMRPIPAATSGGVQIRVPLTDEPVFIEGVDAYLALFSGSLKFEPTFIPAVGSEHEHRVILTNPWPIRITGQVQVRKVDDPTKPRGAEWRVEPNVLDFAAAPGQSLSLPVTLSIGPGALAGFKDLTLTARVLADRQYPPIRVGTNVELGLKDLDLNPEVVLGPSKSGPDVFVQASVTNKGSSPRTLRLEVSARDTPTQQAQIAALPPGETIMKRFILTESATRLAGRHVRVTLLDEESAARMSKAALVPDGR
ncbi:MAG: hypothetical protein K2W85_07535 [Phycisphaerales bacterium]|nr:hypothetical protein [Phycisphaerales bacterium]